MLNQEGDSDAQIGTVFGDSLEEAYGSKTKKELLNKKQEEEKDQEEAGNE